MTKNYVARLSDGTITTIIVGDYDWAVANLAGEWYDLGAEPLTVGIGYIYDADADVFVAPPVTEE